jgi:hypothetical protein
MRRTGILALVSAVLALGAGGCGEDSTTGPSPSGVVVSGEVLAFRTQTGVPGAAVQFRGDAVVGETQATTDATGHYALSLSAAGTFTVLVDGQYVGFARVTGSRYRGDLLIRGDTCISRYGTLADARTLRPVSGATVSLGAETAISEADGWYRIDLGCPSTGSIGFNTTFMSVSHPNYATRQQVVGRGIAGVSRIDLDLERR